MLCHLSTVKVKTLHVSFFNESGFHILCYDTTEFHAETTE